MNTDDKRIREFAYQIWESEGRPDGQEARHWAMACKLAEAQALAPSPPPARQARTRPATTAAKTTAPKKPRAPRKPSAE
ncbi:DUF2934 domain-containing protein [Pseudomonas putida]|uniref:DUF2934 domain-containing protein n=1 Tax=Pseudomonas putida TaxID=303 RepID=UPI002363407A|nr:DUF2934 domain-containing protein [Pseudomonas putida]MDD2052144.1 DUF2934 domain-containing protein [Pseudomonas putida]